MCAHLQSGIGSASWGGNAILSLAASCVKCSRRAQILYALVEQALQSYDVEQFGVAQYLYTTGAFWFTLLACALVSFGHRLLERGYVWLFRPQVCPGHLHHSFPHPSATLLLPLSRAGTTTARPTTPAHETAQLRSAQAQTLLASLELHILCCQEGPGPPNHIWPTAQHLAHRRPLGPPLCSGSCQKVCALSAQKVRLPCQDFMILAEVEAAEAAQLGPATAQLGWQTLQRLKALEPSAASPLGRARHALRRRVKRSHSATSQRPFLHKASVSVASSLADFKPGKAPVHAQDGIQAFELQQPPNGRLPCPSDCLSSFLKPPQ